MSILRVGVAGALGRLGRVACSAIETAAGLQLAAAFARRAGEAAASGVVTDDDLRAFLARGLDVVVDCTVQPVTLDVARACVDAGVAPVIGATGWSGDDRAALDAQARARGVAALLVPNFSFGALLMMRFAEEAARVLPRCEIVELHHDAKRDAPSGTARLTAERVARTGAPSPPIHSVRLPGLVAHQEVIFGGTGETLTIRHDTLSRDSFGPGIVAAVRAVRAMPPGLTVGLDAVLDASASREAVPR
ncbi:MAG TPA: 4-hydroxy-tetrahydrodipicolinate reductase [Candidatus Baltobacteraceae bacterium]|nr:4-hydroxy-tetrahydrodipicolinate reductase [Candidatus Baltobacteraceae bacterium]